MNRQMVVDENFVDRYLLGKLSESEAMAFEDFYAGSPETLEELESSALLIDSLNTAARSGDVAANVRPLRRPTVRQRLTRAISTPAYGMAASFIAAAALLFAGSSYFGEQDQGSGIANSINIPVITLSATRSAARPDDTGIEILAADAPQVVLALDLGIARSETYSAALHAANGDFIWSSEGLKPDDLESLTLSVAKDSLPAGNYRITVRPVNGPGDTLLFPFSIKR